MLFFKQKEQKETVRELKAFVSGQVIPVEKVDDPVFSTKMLGDGVAILPEALAQRESGLQVGTVPEVRFFRQFACALHRQKAPSPALEAFLALLRDQTAAKTGPLSP